MMVKILPLEFLSFDLLKNEYQFQAKHIVFRTFYFTINGWSHI